MFPFVDPALAARLELTHAWRGIHYARAQQTLHPERALSDQATPADALNEVAAKWEELFAQNPLAFEYKE